MKRFLRHSLTAFLALLPFAAGLRAQDKSIGLNTICLDPGHGGYDPGCISIDGKKTMEKDIPLAIGLKVRKLLQEAYPEVKVLMTRDDDTFVELGERAAVAKRGKAGLFLSIHVNSVDPKLNKQYASVTGFSIHTLGQSKKGYDLISNNMALCKRENSVILLEDDYTTKYQGFDPSDPESYIIFSLMQNANLSQSLEFAEDLGAHLTGGAEKKTRGISPDPVLVLWMTPMPAVLLDCGFITNAGDLEAMRTEAGQDKIAKGIFEAISAFKRRYDSSVGTAPASPGPTAPEAPKAETPTPDKPKAETPKTDTRDSEKPKDEAPALTSGYGTQVLASGKLLSEKDSFFKGRKVTVVKSGTLYKYIVGASDKLSAAREEKKKLEKDFPGAFLVQFSEEGTKLVR